jgi:hypothetical protein
MFDSGHLVSDVPLLNTDAQKSLRNLDSALLCTYVVRREMENISGGPTFWDPPHRGSSGSTSAI